jgi:hypothetical protein
MAVPATLGLGGVCMAWVPAARADVPVSSPPAMTLSTGYAVAGTTVTSTTANCSGITMVVTDGAYQLAPQWTDPGETQDLGSGTAIFTWTVPDDVQAGPVLFTAQCKTGVASATLDVGGSDGYVLAGSDGGAFTYGAGFAGSLGGHTLNAPITGVAETADGGGYLMVAADGGVFALGDAAFSGSAAGSTSARAVGIGALPDGGYVVAEANGAVAVFSGSVPDSAGGLLQNEPDTSHGPIPGLRAPIVGLAVDWVTGGYWLVAADGGVFAYNAPFEGSTGGLVLNQPVVGMAFDAATGGYWLVAADGGVFSFNAPFQGSTGGMRLNQPIVGMAPDAATDGYRLVAADGGVFSFHAPFDGSTGGLRLAAPVVAVTAAPGSPS